MTNETCIRLKPHNLTPELLGDLFKLWELVQQQNYNHKDTVEDKIVWTLESDGKYIQQVQRTRYSLHDNRSTFPQLF